MEPLPAVGRGECSRSGSISGYPITSPASSSSLLTGLKEGACFFLAVGSEADRERGLRSRGVEQQRPMMRPRGDVSSFLLSVTSRSGNMGVPFGCSATSATEAVVETSLGPPLLAVEPAEVTGAIATDAILTTEDMTEHAYYMLWLEMHFPEGMGEIPHPQRR